MAPLGNTHNWFGSHVWSARIVPTVQRAELVVSGTCNWIAVAGVSLVCLVCTPQTEDLESLRIAGMVMELENIQVEYIEPDYLVHTSESRLVNQTNVPRWVLLGALTAKNIPLSRRAYTYTYDGAAAGKGVAAHILDTGIFGGAPRKTPLPPPLEE